MAAFCIRDLAFFSTGDLCITTLEALQKSSNTTISVFETRCRTQKNCENVDQHCFSCNTTGAYLCHFTSMLSIAKRYHRLSVNNTS